MIADIPQKPRFYADFRAAMENPADPSTTAEVFPCAGANPGGAGSRLRAMRFGLAGEPSRLAETEFAGRQNSYVPANAFSGCIRVTRQAG